MRYAWFWDEVSPNSDGTGPDRLEHAFGSLLQGRRSGQPVPRPREGDLKQLAERHGTDILQAVVDTSVSPFLVLAVMSVESAGRVNAVSPAGAQGLMQLMPATAQRFGVSDSFDATQNISGGVAYLDFLMRLFEEDPILVLAGYNAGENAVRRHSGVPPFAETRDYVPQVLAALQIAQGLCPQSSENKTEFCTIQQAGT